MEQRPIDTYQMQQEEVQQGYSKDLVVLDRPYQDPASKLIIDRSRTSLIAPMGSGKTKIILEALCNVHNYSPPTLVICGGSSIAVWKEEIHKWWPWLDFEDPHTIGIARGPDRHPIWTASHMYTWIITTYGTMLRDWEIISKIKWQTIILDEAHKFRNRKSKTYKAVKHITLDTQRVIMATGTPVRHGPQDLFTMFQIHNRKTFSSYWKYVGAWCHVEDGEFGKEIFGVRNAANLKAEVRSRFVVIDEENISQYMPERQRIIVPVEMSPVQHKAYDEVRDEMIADLDGALIVTPTVLSKITRLRQLLCTPKLLNPDTEIGGAIRVMVERLEEEPHAVIFTPFRSAIPFIKEYLVDHGNINPAILFELHGKISKNPRYMQSIIDEFKRTRGIMLCTIAFAESFSLETASCAHMIGYDWVPDTNAQAEDRIRRTNSEHSTVKVFYYKHEGTIDGDILSALNTKQRITDIIMKPTKLAKLLKGDSK